MISSSKIKQFLIVGTLILSNAKDMSSSCCKHEDSWERVRAISASSASSNSVSVRSPGAFTRKPSLSYCTDIAERFVFPSAVKHVYMHEKHKKKKKRKKTLSRKVKLGRIFTSCRPFQRFEMAFYYSTIPTDGRCDINNRKFYNVTIFMRNPLLHVQRYRHCQWWRLKSKSNFKSDFS